MNWLCKAMLMIALPMLATARATQSACAAIPETPQALAKMMEEPNRAIALKAVAAIDARASADPFGRDAWAMAWLWPDALMRGKHYNLAAKLTLSAVQRYPWNTGIVQSDLRFRVLALLAVNHPHQALAAAHSLFNVCTTPQVRGTLLLVAQCLNAAHPDHPELVAELVSQEQKAAVLPRGNAIAATCPILLNIPINPGIYQKSLKENSTFGDLNSIVARFNLLLMMGKVAEAQHSLSQLQQFGGARRMGQDAAARWWKAKTGGIAMSNQIIAQQQAAFGPQPRTARHRHK
ncbi:MAG: hypothetical protein HKL96_02005 [Phycisphaerales bacterium]|nr:hypothetical protein [Phycisphaerales bacterium]